MGNPRGGVFRARAKASQPGPVVAPLWIGHARRPACVPVGRAACAPGAQRRDHAHGGALRRGGQPRWVAAGSIPDRAYPAGDPVARATNDRGRRAVRGWSSGAPREPRAGWRRGLPDAARPRCFPASGAGASGGGRGWGAGGAGEAGRLAGAPERPRAVEHDRGVAVGDLAWRAGRAGAPARPGHERPSAVRAGCGGCSSVAGGDVGRRRAQGVPRAGGGSGGVVAARGGSHDRCAAGV